MEIVERDDGDDNNNLTKQAYPSPDTISAVSSAPVMRQLGANSAGQDEEVGLPSQKWPSLALKPERWSGESGWEARRTKGVVLVELNWRWGETRERGEERQVQRSVRTTKMEDMVCSCSCWLTVEGGASCWEA